MKRKILAIMTVIGLMFTVAACGKGSDAGTGAGEAETKASVAASESAPSKEEAAAIPEAGASEEGTGAVTGTGAEEEEALDTNGDESFPGTSNDLFSIKMPEEFSGIYEADATSNSVSIYDKEAKDGGFGGFVFQVMASKGPEDYIAGMCQKVGELTAADGTIYDIVLLYASDIQYDVEKYAEKGSETYDKLTKSAEDIVKSLEGVNGGSFVWGAGMKGEDLYGDVLQKYVTAIKEEWDAERLESEEMSSMYAVMKTGGDDVLDRAGYAYFDVNGDGVEELFIGEIADGEWKGIVYDVYTMVDHKPAHVVSGWDRSRYFAIPGLLVNEYSGGAAESGYNIYSLEENSTNLMLQLTLKTDTSENEESPWFISYDEGSTWEPMTEKEYNERLKDFTDYKRFDYTPFSKVSAQ